MKSKFYGKTVTAVLCFLLFFLPALLPAQNVGIGTNTPGATLHVVSGPSGYAGGYFPGAILEGSGNTYFNFLTPAASEAGFLFGRPGDAAHGGIVYNNTGTPNGLQFRTGGNLTRMVINPEGKVGIGTTAPGFPLNFASSLGDKISIWGNSGAHYGFGLQSGLLQVHTDIAASDIAFGYGSSGAFTENLRIKGTGILQFPPALGKKIVLFPGNVGDAGFGVFGNELRIASDYSGADITFGYDNRLSGFTEKFRMKANGALVVAGNQGQPGQVLTSTGAASPAWSSGTNTLYNNTVSVTDGTATSVSNYDFIDLPGMSYSFSLAGNAKVFVSYSIPVATSSCAFCSSSKIFVDLNINGNRNSRNEWEVPNGGFSTLSTSKVITLAAGNYTMKLSASAVGPNAIYSPCCVFENVMNIQVIPQ
jgi:hypothetical protein